MNIIYQLKKFKFFTNKLSTSQTMLSFFYQKIFLCGSSAKSHVEDDKILIKKLSNNFIEK